MSHVEMPAEVQAKARDLPEWMRSALDKLPPGTIDKAPYIISLLALLVAWRSNKGQVQRKGMSHLIVASFKGFFVLPAVILMVLLLAVFTGIFFGVRGISRSRSAKRQAVGTSETRLLPEHVAEDTAAVHTVDVENDERFDEQPERAQQ